MVMSLQSAHPWAHVVCSSDLDGSDYSLYRCALVRRGAADRGLCRRYLELLRKYGLSEVWDALPRDPADPLWKQWNLRVHRAVLTSDLSSRFASLASKPHYSFFCSLKPPAIRSFPSYLRSHGLGQWVKLRLRSDSLQLLAVLGRYVSPPLPASSLVCRLCNSGVEDAAHFLCRCSSLTAERSQLLVSLSSLSELSSLAVFSHYFLDLSSWSPSRSLPILLGSIEDPCESASRRHRSSPLSLFLILAEPLILNFLASLWTRSAFLLGRVPSLSVHGDGLSTTILLPDGRCRSFSSRSAPS